VRDTKLEFMAHTVVGVILSTIRRNGLEKTLEDLHASCQHMPESDELVYQGLLKIISNITDEHKRIAEAKRSSN